MRHDPDESVVDGATTARIRTILWELEDADFVRLDPPADVWERIEAAVAQGSTTAPKEPPSRETRTTEVVEYWIDADDVVIEVGRSWADSARSNDAPELAVLPAGRTLWDYFDSDDVRDLWRLLVERVRRLRSGAEVPLRCDAPDARRWFTMTITAEPNDRVRFRCALVFEESRRAVSLLDLRSERDAELQPVALCSWCGRGHHDGRWVDVEELVQSSRLLERTWLPRGWRYSS